MPQIRSRKSSSILSRDKATPPAGWRAKFLETLAECAEPRKAAKAAGVMLRFAKGQRDRDPKFAGEWNEAVGVAAEKLTAGRKRCRSIFDALDLRAGRGANGPAGG